MNVFIVYDDAYDRNVICVTTDYSVAVEAFHNHNDELIADGYVPNGEHEIDQLIETHPLIPGKNQVIYVGSE
jgi:hypothetical protein